MQRQIFEILVLGLAAATMAVTLSRGKIFRKQRLWLKGWWPWAGDLFSCPYCLSHWIVLGFLWPYHPHLIEHHLWLNVIASYFSLVGISALFAGSIMSLIHFGPDTDPEDSEIGKLTDMLKMLSDAVAKLKEDNANLMKSLEEREKEIANLQTAQTARRIAFNYVAEQAAILREQLSKFEKKKKNK